jgi:hypothetical protein
MRKLKRDFSFKEYENLGEGREIGIPGINQMQNINVLDIFGGPQRSFINKRSVKKSLKFKN